jgi:chemotaxis protein MotB
MSRRRSSREEEGASHERWLVSYADFITLMFAFFAVLYATSEKDLNKGREFQDSIKKYLIKGGGAFGGPAPSVNQADKHDAAIESPIQTFNKSAKPEEVKALDQAESFVESNFTPEERKKYILDLSSDDWGVRLTLSSAQIYADGSDRFRAEAMPFINKLGGVITKSRRKTMIEGYVREGETGGLHSTWDFASARAINMLRFVQKRENLSPKVLAATSYGDSRPVYEGDQAHLNSRLEIVLLNQDVEF